MSLKENKQILSKRRGKGKKPFQSQLSKKLEITDILACDVTDR